MTLLNDRCDLCGTVAQAPKAQTGNAGDLRMWCGLCTTDRVPEVSAWLDGIGDAPDSASIVKEVRVHPRVVTFGGILATIAVSAWLLMLVLGAIHDSIPAVPALNYAVVGLSLVGLRMVLAVFPAWHTHTDE